MPARSGPGSKACCKLARPDHQVTKHLVLHHSPSRWSEPSLAFWASRTLGGLDWLCAAEQAQPGRRTTMSGSGVGRSGQARPPLTPAPVYHDELGVAEGSKPSESSASAHSWVLPWLSRGVVTCRRTPQTSGLLRPLAGCRKVGPRGEASLWSARAAQTARCSGARHTPEFGAKTRTRPKCPDRVSVDGEGETTCAGPSRLYPWRRAASIPRLQT